MLSISSCLRKSQTEPCREQCEAVCELRDAHATLALKAGVPVKVISERLGHESPAFTLKQYAHVIPGMQAEVAAQVASLVDGPSPEV